MSVPEQRTTWQGGPETSTSHCPPPPYPITNYNTFEATAAASNEYQSQTSDEYLDLDHYNYIAALQDDVGCVVMYHK